MIVFDCPACKSKLQVPEEHAGKLMRCPSCQTTAPIPVAASAVSAEPIAPPPPAAPAPAPAWDKGDASEERADDRDDRKRDDDRPRRRRRRDRDDRDDRAAPKKTGMGVALTLVIVGIGVCVVGSILAALLIPAVQKVREAAARTQSTNNLKQIALGMQSFHDANKRLPFNGCDANAQFGGAPYTKNAVANTFTSGIWGFQILPYIDEQPTFAIVDRSRPIKTFMCPGRGRPPLESSNGGGAWSDYFYNNYINSTRQADNPSFMDVRRTLVGITDGTSNTILIGHGNIDTSQHSSSANVTLSSNIFLGGTTGTMRAGNGADANPTGVSLLRDSANAPGIGSWGGPFPQGGLMAMGDATVRMFPYMTNNFGAFLTPTGNEPVNLPP